MQKKEQKNCLQPCHGLTWQPATEHQTAARSPPPSPCSGMGRRKGQKGKLVSWDKDSLIRQQKEHTNTANTTTNNNKYNNEYEKQTISVIIFSPPDN